MPYGVGSGTARAPNIRHRFEFNGLTLNNRSVSDRYQVDSVTGFEDADVRDAREPNPGAHGEVPLGAYYAGKTIVLTGKIRAGNILKLEDMLQALRVAFRPIGAEQPLYVRDIASSARDIYINCKKLTKMEAPMNINGWQYEIPFQIQLRASDGRMYSAAAATQVDRTMTGSSAYILDTFGGNSTTPFAGANLRWQDLQNNLTGTTLNLVDAKESGGVLALPAGKRMHGVARQGTAGSGVAGVDNDVFFRFLGTMFPIRPSFPAAGDQPYVSALIKILDATNYIEARFTFLAT